MNRSTWLVTAALTLGFGCGSPPAPAPPPRPVPEALPDTAAPAAEVAPPTSTPAPAAAAPANPPAGIAPSHVDAHTFSSPALGVTKRYVVWLPRGYDDSSHRFPVLYLLHGLGGNESNWVDHGKLPASANALAFSAIVVMPDGDDGFYANSPTRKSYDACLAQKPPFDKAEKPSTYCVKTPLYEDYVIKDLIADVDGAYRTIPTKAARAISGLSMGGFGAMSLALRHPDLFVAAASHSGMVSLLYVGPHPYVRSAVRVAQDPAQWGGQYQPAFREHVKSVFGPSIEIWRGYDPTALVANMPAGALALFFDCGSSDGFKFQDHAQYLHDLLQERGVAHQFALAPGDHNWGYWSAHLPESLKFVAAAFAKGPPNE